VCGAGRLAGKSTLGNRTVSHRYCFVRRKHAGRDIACDSELLRLAPDVKLIVQAVATDENHTVSSTDAEFAHSVTFNFA